jgi:plastocyanin
LKPVIIIVIAFVLLFVPIGVYADTITVDIARGSSTPTCASSNSCYSPYTTTISSGDKVIWKNSDSVTHTVTSGDPTMPDTVQVLFDSGTVSAGSTFEWSPTEAGEVPYFCMLHPWMTGLVTVQESTSNLSKRIASVTNDPNKLDWAIMFVTTTNKCYANHEQALDFYTTLTQQYLNDFNLQHRSVFSECITDDIMPEVINRITKSVDLTIVIPDYLMSVSDRHNTSSLGHYSNWNVDTIVSQAQTLSIESKKTGWILSHELSHFALNWKGYDGKIMNDAVHKVEDEYRYCKSKDTTLVHCAFLWDTIQTPSNNWFPVMSPDYVIEIAESMKPTKIMPKTSTTPKSIEKNTTFANWVTTGKTVYNDQKITLEGSVWGNTKLDGRWEFIRYQDVKIYNSGTFIGRDTTDSQGNFKFSTYLPLGKSHFSVKYDGSNEWYGSTTQGPIFTAIEKQTVDKKITSPITSKSEKPNSFVIKKVELVKIKLNSIKTNDPIIGYVTDSDHYWGDKRPNFILSKQTTQGWEEVITVEGKFGSGWYEGNFGDARYYSDGKYKMNYMYGNTDTRILYQGTAFFEINNNRESDKPQSKSNSFLDKDNDGIADSKDLCNTKPENYNRYQDTDGCPDTKPQSKETKKINLDQEVRDLQIKSYAKIDSLKKDIETSKKILEKLSPDNSEQSHKVNQAWNLLKTSQEKLKAIEIRVEKGDTQLGYGNYENAKTFFSNNDKMSKSIGDYLKGIPVLVEEAKPQTCFLMWCW